jgi:hypothetical protein
MITDEQILLRELNHQIKLSKGTITHKRNPCLSGYEQFNRDFESQGYQITPDHNDLNKRMLSGKGTGTKPKSSGRKKYTGEPTIDWCNHKCIGSERDPHKNMDGGLEMTQVKQECK